MSNIKIIQSQHVEILKEVALVAKKNKINLFAIFGTLLGSVRHGGFIPWDDDVDVAVNQRDFVGFLEALEKELPAGFNLGSRKHSKNANGNNGAIVSKKFGDSIIAVDIFVMGNIKDNIRKNPWSISLVYGLILVRSSRDSFWQTVASVLLHIFPKKFYIWLSDRVVDKKTTNDKTKKMKILVDDFTNWFDSEPFENPRTFNFEGVEILVPSDASNYLEAAYGDWEKIPSDKEKADHLHY